MTTATAQRVTTVTVDLANPAAANFTARTSETAARKDLDRYYESWRQNHNAEIIGIPESPIHIIHRPSRPDYQSIEPGRLIICGIVPADFEQEISGLVAFQKTRDNRIRTALAAEMLAERITAEAYHQPPVSSEIAWLIAFQKITTEPRPKPAPWPDDPRPMTVDQIAAELTGRPIQHVAGYTQFLPLWQMEKRQAEGRISQEHAEAYRYLWRNSALRYSHELQSYRLRPWL